MLVSGYLLLAPFLGVRHKRTSFLELWAFSENSSVANDAQPAVVSQGHLVRLGLEWRTGDLYVAADERVFDALINIYDATVLQHNGMLDLTPLDEHVMVD